MRHSRNLALLTGDYLDRPIDVVQSVGAPSAGAVLWTYTVGTNIQSRIEQTYVIVTGGAANAVRSWIQVNRMGTIIVINEVISNGGVPYQVQNLAHDILLQTGDIVQSFWIDGTAGTVVAMGAMIREVDL